MNLGKDNKWFEELAEILADDDNRKAGLLIISKLKAEDISFDQVMNFFSSKKVHEKYLADFLLVKFFPDKLSCDQLMFIYRKYTDDLRDEAIYAALQRFSERFSCVELLKLQQFHSDRVRFLAKEIALALPCRSLSFFDLKEYESRSDPRLRNLAKELILKLGKGGHVSSEFLIKEWKDPLTISASFSALLLLHYFSDQLSFMLLLQFQNCHDEEVRALARKLLMQNFSSEISLKILFNLRSSHFSDVVEWATDQIRKIPIDQLDYNELSKMADELAEELIKKIPLERQLSKLEKSIFDKYCSEFF